MGKNLPVSKKILICGIVACVLAVSQYFVVTLVRWLAAQSYISGFQSEALFGITWMMIPLLSFSYSIAAIFNYFVRSSKDNVTTIGLYFACISIPLNIILFVINTNMGII